MQDKNKIAAILFKILGGLLLLYIGFKLFKWIFGTVVVFFIAMVVYDWFSEKDKKKTIIYNVLVGVKPA